MLSHPLRAAFQYDPKLEKQISFQPEGEEMDRFIWRVLNHHQPDIAHGNLGFLHTQICLEFWLKDIQNSGGHLSHQDVGWIHHLEQLGNISWLEPKKGLLEWWFFFREFLQNGEIACKWFPKWSLTCFCCVSKSVVTIVWHVCTYLLQPHECHAVHTGQPYLHLQFAIFRRWRS